MALTLKQALAMFWEQIQVRFVKRENGKGLSTNDFTTEEKNKLASLKNTTIDTTLTVSNAAADAKAVGDVLAEKQPAGDYALKTEILPADWNENDPNSSAYVKNRTHYADSGNVDCTANLGIVEGPFR